MKTSKHFLHAHFQTQANIQPCLTYSYYCLFSVPIASFLSVYAIAFIIIVFSKEKLTSLIPMIFDNLFSSRHSSAPRRTKKRRESKDFKGITPCLWIILAKSDMIMPMWLQ